MYFKDRLSRLEDALLSKKGTSHGLLAKDHTKSATAKH